MDEQAQRMKILHYCQKHGSITIREAYKLDMNSPSKRISEMRNSDDYVVEDKWEYRINSKGIKKRYKRYYIREVVS